MIENANLRTSVANGTCPWIPPNRATVPGSDASGEIISVGPGVKSWEIGDKVFPAYYRHFREGAAPNELTGHDVPGLDAPGVLCEYAVFPEHALIRSPKNLSHEETASLVCSGLTAWNALYGCSPITSDSWVLVQGTGGVSMLAIQFALAEGATVIATTSSEAKAEMLRGMGVQHVLDCTQDKDWGQTARMLTPNWLGCDHVVEVGGPSTIVQSFKSVARGGSIDVIGFLAGQNNLADAPPWIQPLLSACGVRGIEVGSVEQCRQMVKAIEEKGIKPVLDSMSFTLKQLPTVYRLVWAGQHVGKVRISGIE